MSSHEKPSTNQALDPTLRDVRLVPIVFVLGCLNCVTIPTVVHLAEAVPSTNYCAIGIIAAQLGLLAAWTVFSTASLIERYQIIVGVAFFWIGCLIAGGVASSSESDGVELSIVAVLLVPFSPWILFLFQTPFFVARIYSRWTINSRSPSSNNCGVREFQTFGLVAFGISLLPIIFAMNAMPIFIVLFVVFSVCVTLLGLITITPLALIMLRRANTSAVTIGACSWVIWIAGLFAVASPMNRYSVLVSLMLTFAVGLLVVRNYGYRIDQTLPSS